MKSGNCVSPRETKSDRKDPIKAKIKHKPPVIPKANFNDFMSSFLPTFSDNISFKAKKPNYQEATIHYISGFVLLVMLRLTLEQKVVNGLLSITPYAYYEMVLDRKKS